MNGQIRKIALEEKSFDVQLLHQALNALGLPVAKQEVSARKAGKSTLSKVRTLQKRMDIPIDEAVLVDQATAVALEAALREQQLTGASHSFILSGTVRLSNGQVKKRQSLLAFDVDLHGVATYRSIEKIADLSSNGGYEFLGSTHSNNQGKYRITFS